MVTISCEFTDFIEGVSCVLVYREYTKSILVVEEYPVNTVFPVTVMVDDPNNYTFAIFGKKGFDIDERPMLTVLAPTLSTPSVTESGINAPGQLHYLQQSPTCINAITQHYFKYSPYYDELDSVAKRRYDKKLNMLPGCVNDPHVGKWKNHFFEMKGGCRDISS